MDKEKKEDIEEETPWWNKMPEGSAGVTGSLPKVGRPSWQASQPQANQSWTQGLMPNSGIGVQQTWQNAQQQMPTYQPGQMGNQQGFVQQPSQGQQTANQPPQNAGMGQQPVISNYAVPFGGVSPQMGTAYQQAGMPNVSQQAQGQGSQVQASEKPSKGFSLPDLPWMKIFGIGAVIVALVAVLGVGVTFAMTMSGNDAGDQPGNEQPQTSEEPEKAASNIYVTVTADGADENSSAAGVIVYKGDSGEDVALSETSAAPGTRVLLGSLDEGSYRLHVETVPTNKDGSTYSAPFFDQTFEVKGDGEDVDVKLTLDAIEKKTDDSTDDGTGDDQSQQDDSDSDKADEEAKSEEPSTDTKDADKSNKKASEKKETKKDKTPKSDKKTSSASAQNKKQATTTTQHTHSWQPVTKTVHHKAKYRTVKHDAVKSRVTICNECGQDITGSFSSHKASTGHSSYHYENKVTRKAYTEKVLVSKAYDETKVTGYKCKTCGKKRS